MSKFDIIHIDDDSDVRLVVKLALGTQPDFEIRSCASGPEAIPLAAQRPPHLILCDVQIPDMDGPAILAALRQTPATSAIPFAFMTAGPRPDEIAHLTSMGACAVIAKPFSPKGLCETVRNLLQASVRSGFPEMLPDEIAAEQSAFRARLRSDHAAFARLRAGLNTSPAMGAQLEQIKTLSHKLAGAAACFDYPEVSLAASALEGAAMDALRRQAPTNLDAELDHLSNCIERQVAPLQ